MVYGHRPWSLAHRPWSTAIDHGLWPSIMVNGRWFMAVDHGRSMPPGGLGGGAPQLRGGCGGGKPPHCRGCGGGTAPLCRGVWGPARPPIFKNTKSVAHKPNFGHQFVGYNFWHVFLKIIICYLVAKANFGRVWVVLGEIIIYCLFYSVANILISGLG